MTDPRVMSLMSAERLRIAIEEACMVGRLTLMKQANHPQNLGKVPSLVLAEMLIAVMNEPEGDGA